MFNNILCFMIVIWLTYATYDISSKSACFNNIHYNMATIFTAPQNGTLNGIKLRYINNSVSPATTNISNNWKYPLQTFFMHVTNNSEFTGDIYYPSSNTQNVNLINSTCDSGCIYLSYTLQTSDANNSINYTLLNPAYNVSTNDQFMLQYSDACCANNSNLNKTISITTCASIYFLYSKQPTPSPTTKPTIKDNNEGINPTVMTTATASEEETTFIPNNNKNKSSKLNSKTVAFLAIAIIFLFTVLTIGIYLKRKGIVVQLNLNNLKVGLLSDEGGYEDTSGQLQRLDTLPTHNTIFENKTMSFELMGSLNESIVPGDVKRSKVKLSVVSYADRMDGFYVKALTDYNDDSEDQLKFKENAIFWIIETTESGWWYGIDEMGYDGWVPSNYVVKLDKKERDELKQQQAQKTCGENYINLLTEPMDKSYNKVKENGITFEDIPDIIAPPIHFTSGADIVSSSSSDEMDFHKTVGSVTRNDKY